MKLPPKKSLTDTNKSVIIVDVKEERRWTKEKS